ncbi:MAG: glycosyltransferase [Coriobacteriia bacterium]|nr:glycosyltransferase [Coriobacteriia bacterium]
MFHLACALAENPDFGVHFLLNELPARRIDGCDVAVHRVEAGVGRGEGPRLLSIFTNAVRAVRPFIRTGARVYVLCGASMALGYVGILRLLARRKRVVFIVASDADAEGALLKDAWFERSMFRVGIRLADVVWCQNRHQQEAISRRYGRETLLLPNGLPMPAEPPSSATRHVLWVASCQPLKQPHVYLDLAEAVPEEQFVMIMPPRKDDALFTEVAKRASALSNVEFIEGVHYRQIQRYFDEAKVFVNTSTVEGYPNTFVQSMIGATPIVSLSVDPNGILSEHGLGYCAGGDIEQLETRIRQLVTDESLRSAIGARSFRYARTHHDIERVAGQFEEMLTDVL